MLLYSTVLINYYSYYMLSLFNSFITFISDVLVAPMIRHKVRTAIVAVVVALVGYQVVVHERGAVIETPVATTASVELITAAGSQSASTFSAIGTVQAISEAELRAEAGGQVTGVYTDIGKSVRAGAILAQTENARESASLLQAQGSYEAALAGSAQGDSGVRDAKNGLENAKNAAVTTYKSTYTSVSGVLFGTIDQFFANPTTVIPGVRLGYTDTQFLNSERVALQKTLPAWKTNAVSLTTTGNLEAALNEAEVTTKKVLAITDSFIDALNKQTRNVEYTEEQLRALGLSFNAVRAELIRDLAAIDGARSGLKSATEALNRAELSGGEGQVTLSGAQLKIALGSLRSAQAAYEKTVIRTPISGVVNALYLKKGDYVAPGTNAALVANNKGLQVETAINQNDRDLLAIGDNVIINDTASGTISAIAGAVDPTTGKIAVKISIADTAGLENGTVAKITLTSTKQPAATVTSEVKIPLAAIKLLATGPVVFTVDGDSKLVAVPIELGPVTVDSVVVKSGLAADQQIVADARGHKAGEIVSVTTK